VAHSQSQENAECKNDDDKSKIAFHDIKSLIHAAKIRFKLKYTKEMRHFFDAFFLSTDIFQLWHDDNSDIRHAVVLDDLERVEASAIELGGCNGCGP